MAFSEALSSAVIIIPQVWSTEIVNSSAQVIYLVKCASTLLKHHQFQLVVNMLINLCAAFGISSCYLSPEIVNMKRYAGH